ncbi:hypothetical protein [Arthrobacter sp. UYEF3]|uniref:hypothetical protein n=1 Tax=Arthrobacter sp. UYEF3 TaxID=1756365 RepID=UPI003399286B
MQYQDKPAGIVRAVAGIDAAIGTTSQCGSFSTTEQNIWAASLSTRHSQGWKDPHSGWPQFQRR